jgi:hypothetical protein
MAVREKKQITYKGKSTKITADFSMETLKARREWSEVFQVLKENNTTATEDSTRNSSHRRQKQTKPWEDRKY